MSRWDGFSSQVAGVIVAIIGGILLIPAGFMVMDNTLAAIFYVLFILCVCIVLYLLSRFLSHSKSLGPGAIIRSLRRLSEADPSQPLPQTSIISTLVAWQALLPYPKVIETRITYDEIRFEGLVDTDGDYRGEYAYTGRNASQQTITDVFLQTGADSNAAYMQMGVQVFQTAPETTPGSNSGARRLVSPELLPEGDHSHTKLLRVPLAYPVPPNGRFRLEWSFTWPGTMQRRRVGRDYVDVSRFGKHDDDVRKMVWGLTFSEPIEYCHVYCCRYQDGYWRPYGGDQQPRIEAIGQNKSKVFWEIATPKKVGDGFLLVFGRQEWNL